MLGEYECVNNACIYIYIYKHTYIILAELNIHEVGGHLNKYIYTYSQNTCIFEGVRLPATAKLP